MLLVIPRFIRAYAQTLLAIATTSIAEIPQRGEQLLNGVCGVRSIGEGLYKIGN